MWGMLDRGSLDGSVPNADGDGQKDGVYFQYWDPTAAATRLQRRPGRPRAPRLRPGRSRQARHQGDCRFAQQLACVRRHRPIPDVVRAQRFTTSSSPRPSSRQALSRLGQARASSARTPSTAASYRDDPTVFAWELANEPRCKGGNDAFDSSSGWDKATLTNWAREMSDVHQVTRRQSPGVGR